MGFGNVGLWVGGETGVCMCVCGKYNTALCKVDRCLPVAQGERDLVKRKGVWFLGFSSEGIPTCWDSLLGVVGSLFEMEKGNRKDGVEGLSFGWNLSIYLM